MGNNCTVTAKLFSRDTISNTLENLKDDLSLDTRDDYINLYAKMFATIAEQAELDPEMLKSELERGDLDLTPYKSLYQNGFIPLIKKFGIDSAKTLTDFAKNEVNLLDSIKTGLAFYADTDTAKSVSEAIVTAPKLDSGDYAKTEKAVIRESIIESGDEELLTQAELFSELLESIDTNEQEATPIKTIFAKYFNTELLRTKKDDFLTDFRNKLTDTLLDDSVTDGKAGGIKHGELHSEAILNLRSSMANNAMDILSSIAPKIISTGDGEGARELTPVFDSSYATVSKYYSNVDGNITFTDRVTQLQAFIDYTNNINLTPEEALIKLNSNDTGVSYDIKADLMDQIHNEDNLTETNIRGRIVNTLSQYSDRNVKVFSREGSEGVNALEVKEISLINGFDKKVLLVTKGDTDEALAFYMNEIGTPIYEVADGEKSLTVDSFSKDTELKFAFSLIGAEFFHDILKAAMPYFSDAYREGYRNDFSTSIPSAAKQDSKKQKFLKESTRRLKWEVRNGKRVLVQDSIAPHLSTGDFDLISDELAPIRQNVNKMIDYIKKEGSPNSKNPHKDIYTSIYHRFYDPNDYNVLLYDITSGEPSDVISKFRSIKAIYDKQGAAQSEADVSKQSIVSELYGESSDGYAKNLVSAISTSLSNDISLSRLVVSGPTVAESGVLARNLEAAVEITLKSSAFTTPTVADNATLEKTKFFLTRKVANAFKSDRFKFDADDKTLTLTIGKDINARTVVFKFEQNNPSSIGEEVGAKYSLVPMDYDTRQSTKNLEALWELVKDFGIPKKLVTPKVRSVLTDYLAKYDEGTRTNPDGLLGKDKYMSLLLNLMLRFNAMKNGSTEQVTKDLWIGKKALAATFNHIIGSEAPREVDTVSGKVPLQTVPSAVSALDYWIKKAAIPEKGSIHRNSLLATGRVKLDGILYRSDIRHGATVKDAREITPLENIAYSIESIFWDSVTKSPERNEMRLPAKPFGPRKTQPIEKYKTIPQNEAIKGSIEGEDDYMIFPVKGKRLDTDLLKRQFIRSNKIHFDTIKNDLFKYWEDAFIKLGKSKFSNIIKKYSTLAQLDDFLVTQAGKLSIDRIEKDSGLDKNFAYVNDGGVARISPALLAKESLFTSKEETKILGDVSTLLGVNLRTFSDLISATKDIETKKQVRSAFPTLFDIDGNLHKDTADLLKYSIGNTQLELHIESLRNSFKSYLEDNGYNKESMSINSINKLASILNVKHVDKEVAFNSIIDSYFYNVATIGNEGSRMMAGPIEQYRPSTYKDVTGKKLYRSIIPKEFLEAVRTDADYSKAVTAISKYIGTLDTPDAELYREIINNKSINNRDKVKLIYYHDYSKTVSEGVVDQVKRNTSLGSSGIMPILQETLESGFNLGKSSKVILYDDPTEIIHALNSLFPNKSFEVYNAMQIALPLFGMRLNNSNGNLESNFRTDFNAVKDITIGVYDNGVLGIEKKTVLLPGRDMLQNMTPEFEHIIYKMLSTIPFGVKGEGIELRVPDLIDGVIEKHPTTFQSITKQDWIEHGKTLGLLKIIDKDGNATRMYAADALNKIRYDKDFKTEFVNAIDSGNVLTGMVKVKFHNVYDLWKYYGGSSDINSWELTGNHLGNYTGVRVLNSKTIEHTFSENHNPYPLRDAYIEKIGFTSQKKEGQRHVMHSEDFINPIEAANSNFKYEGNARWDEVPNDGERVILNSMHSNDTTAKSGFVPNFSTGELHPEREAKDSDLAFLQQAYGSLISGLDNIEDVRKTENSLASLSLMGASEVYSAIKDRVLEAYNNILLDSNFSIATSAEDIRAINNGFRDGMLAITPEDSELNTALRIGYRDYANELLDKSLKSSETAGTIADFGTKEIKNNLSYSLKLISDYITQVVAQKMKANAISFRMPGGEQVLEANHHMMRLYRFGNRTDLTRADLNKAVYFNTKSNYAENVSTFLNSETVKYLTANDYVIPSEENSLGFEVNIPIKVEEIEKRLVSHRGSGVVPSDIGLKAHLHTILVNEGFMSKLEGILHPIHSAEGSGRDLAFMNYIKFDKEGNPVDFKDSDEFKSWSAVGVILDAKPNTTIPEEASLDKGLVIRYYFGKDNYLNMTSEEQRAIDIKYNALLQNSQYKYIAQNKVIDTIRQDAKLAVAKARNAMKLELKTGGYSTDPAEFMMPSFHQELYHVKDHESVADITGPTEIPNWRNLLRSGVIESYSDAFKQSYSNEDISSSSVWGKILLHTVPYTLLNSDTIKSLTIQGRGFNPESTVNEVLNHIGIWDIFNEDETNIQNITELYSKKLSEAALANIAKELGTRKLLKDAPNVMKYILADKVGNIEVTNLLENVLKSVGIKYNETDTNGNVAELKEAAAKTSSQYLTDELPKIAELLKYNKAKSDMSEHMNLVFRKKILEDNIQDKELFTFPEFESYSNSMDVPEIDEQGNIVNPNRFSDMIDSTINTINKRKSFVQYGGLEFKTYDAIVTRLEHIKSYINIESLQEAQRLLDGLVNDPKSLAEVNGYIHNKAKILSDSFLTALEFFTARIPGQGKPSTTIGRIATFYHDGKNLAFAAKMLTAIQGSDFDNDQQHTMVYAFDSDGRFVDWAPYTLSGTLDEAPNFNIYRDKLEKLESDIEVKFKKRLENSKIRIELIRNTRETDYEKIRRLIDSLDIGHLNDKLDAEIKKYKSILKQKSKLLELQKETEYNRFQLALKNHILYMMSKITADPISALEVNSPIDNMEGITEALPKQKAIDGTKKVGSIINSMDIPSEFNPSSDMHYLMLTNAGTKSIPMFASGSRTYFTALLGEAFHSNSILNDVINETLPRGKDIGDVEKELTNSLRMKSQFIKVWDDFNAAYKKVNGETAVPNKYKIQAVFLGDDGEIRAIKELNGLGNTDKLEYKTGLLNKEVEGAYNRLAELKNEYNTTLSESRRNEIEAEQASILNSYTDKFKTIDSFEESTQVWESLSQLINASVDNVKELLLGRIGATTTTNSLIATMVRTGLSIPEAIELLNELYAYKGKNNPIHNIMSKEDFVLERSRKGKLAGFNLAAEIITQTAEIKKTGDDYIKNILVRLSPFAKIDEDFGILNSLTSIYSNANVDRKATWRSRVSINNRINRIIANAYRINGEGGVDKSVFNIRKFIDSALGVTDKSYADNLADSYDKVRSGINIIRIIKENTRLLRYHKAQHDGEILVDMISPNFLAVETMMEKAMDNGVIKLGDIEDRDYAELTRDFSGFSILSYFDHVGKTIKFIDPDGKLKAASYDMSNAADREKFIEAIPDYIERALEFNSNNDFLLKLSDPVRVADKRNKKSIALLESINQMVADSSTILAQQTSLESLSSGASINKEFKNRPAQFEKYKEYNSMLYDMLFTYSLLVHRATFGNKSFSGLFEGSNYMDYSKYLLENIDTIVADYLSDAGNDRAILHTNALLPKVPTNAMESLHYVGKIIGNMRRAKSGSRYGTNSEDNTYMDQEVIPDDIREQIETIQSEYDIGEDGSAPKRTYIDNYNLSILNAQKAEYLKVFPDRFISKSTGIHYKFNNEIEMYVPQIPENVGAAISYNVDPSKIDNKIQNGYVMKYKDNTVTLYGVATDNVINSIKTKQAYADKFKNSNIIFDTKQTLYVIKAETEGIPEDKYLLVTAEQLKHYIEESHYPMIVDGNKLELTYKFGEFTKSPNNLIVTKDKGNAKLYNISYVDTASDVSTAKSMENPIETMGIVGITTDPILKDINNAYTRLQAAVFASDYVGNNPHISAQKYFDAFLQYKLYNIKHTIDLDETTYAPAKKTAFNRFPDSVNILTKLAKIVELIGDKKAIKSISRDFSKLDSGNHTILDSKLLTKINVIRRGLQIPEDLYNTYMSDNVMNSMMIGEFKDFLNTVFDKGKADKMFKSYIKSDIIGDEYKAYNHGDGTYTVGNHVEPDNIIKSTEYQQLEFAKNNTEESKETLASMIKRKASMNTIIDALGINTALGSVRFYKEFSEDLFNNKSGTAAITDKVDPGKTAEFLLDWTARNREKFQKVGLTDGIRKDITASTKEAFSHAVAKRLNTMFDGNARMITLSTEDIAKDLGISVEEAGKIRGYNKDWYIVLNKEQYGSSTPFHEMTHIYFKHLKYENNELYNKLITDVLGTDMMAKVRAKYKNLSEADLAEEALSEIVAQKVTNNLENEESYKKIIYNLGKTRPFDKIRTWLRKIVNLLFNIKTDRLPKMTDSIQTFSDRLSNEFLNSSKSIVEDFSISTKRLVDASITGNIKLADALDLLKDAGFIRKQC